MLRQMCRRGRLDALLGNAGVEPSNKTAHPALQILSSAPVDVDSPVSFSALRQDNLPSPIYNMILRYVNTGRTTSASVRHLQQFPHPTDAEVLPPRAFSKKHLKHKTRNYSIFAMHPGNASVSYRTIDGFLAFGFIKSMWQILLENRTRTFIIVSPHQPLSAVDQVHSPYSLRPGFQCTVVYSRPTAMESWVVIETEHILGHVPYYERPSGTFGIHQKTMVLIESLYRNRD